MTRFSIILPFHNNETTIAPTLESLLKQSFQDWELICVDDSSSDGSARIVTDFAAQDPRITYVQNASRGPSAARNYGVDCAKGDIVAFCDADDCWTADKLAVLNIVFTSNDVAAAYGQIGFFSDTPADCRTWSTVPTHPLTIADLLSENPVCTMSNLSVRRSVFNTIGGLDCGVVHNEDLEFLIRLVGENNKLIGLDHHQVWYRTNPTGLSSDLPAMHAGREYAISVAASYGVTPTKKSQAVYFRYLARRALRLDSAPREAWNYTKKGMRLHPRGFLTPIRRGVPTAVASALALSLPQWARRALFSH